MDWPACAAPAQLAGLTFTAGDTRADSSPADWSRDYRVFAAALVLLMAGLILALL